MTCFAKSVDSLHSTACVEKRESGMSSWSQNAKGGARLVRVGVMVLRWFYDEVGSRLAVNGCTFFFRLFFTFGTVALLFEIFLFE